jgi:hypothetical protein
MDLKVSGLPSLKTQMVFMSLEKGTQNTFIES